MPVLQRAESLYAWVLGRGIVPKAQTLDSLLAVACAHGTVQDCHRVMQRMKHLGIAPTIFTFNTLLDRCAVRRRADEAHSVLAQMSAVGVLGDDTTYNTLLKLHVNLNDVLGAQEVRGE
ncbi:hypothetical protein B484DRAFT_141965 [Ochromonadaceae sp. CCMP2298]|nr:hypothetical protein B484DRAFT_141965 [Ochromonadaceae sp. CCMP2298]